MTQPAGERRRRCEISVKSSQLSSGTLSTSRSFLDRLEQVGDVSANDAREFGLVGPIARASGVSRDLRKAQPYSGYNAIEFEVPRETEGDGFARLRLFFREATQSVRIISKLAERIPDGRFRAPEIWLRPGARRWAGSKRHAGPRCIGFVCVRTAWSIDTESSRRRSRNWHGFRLAAERFAFQDFPIILATFALSVHENDR